MIKNKSIVPTLAALVLFIGGAIVYAKPSPKTSTVRISTKRYMLMLSDADFAKAAAEGGLAEVKLGELAEQKGSSQAVREFGKRMVTDHGKALDTLKAAAGKDNIALPTAIDARDQATYNRLSKLSGDAFDRAYAMDMVRDHTADVAHFRREADRGRDAAIKVFASQTLPTIENHLKLAKELPHTASATKSSHNS